VFLLLDYNIFGSHLIKLKVFLKIVAIYLTFMILGDMFDLIQATKPY